MSLQRLLAPLVEVRKDEATTAVLMFAYSFLAFTSYNIVQPLTRSKVIASLGAVNVPWVVLASGLLISVLMLGYTRLMSALPRRWALPITQGGMAAVMVVFWALFQTGGDWVSVAFFVWGALLGILLISQFWTLANGIYDPRQAKRLFGFIGGGVMLGGMTGSALTAAIIERVGTNTLLLWSAFAMLACMVIVSVILGREGRAAPGVEALEERGVTIARAFAMLRDSKQIQLIAVVIGFGALGASLIEQQVNMAAEVFKGAGQEDSIGGFLAQIRFYISAAAFVIQVWITPSIHRYLGIAFALLILPTSLAGTALLIIMNQVLWAPAVATVIDRSFRYSADKTTREVLFLPLPSELRQEIKPFVDVTVDRLTKAGTALLILVLIQPWGAALAWHQLSFVSLGLAALWYVVAFRAKREYLVSFRRSLEQRVVRPEEVRLSGGDLSTIETLVEELANPDAERVLYAIDVLESLDKRNLVTPLLLYHEAPKVRARALLALAAARTDTVRRWTPNIRRLLADPDPRVRAAAISALGAISNEDAASVARPMLDDPDPRIRSTAAAALAGSTRPSDVELAEATLVAIIGDTSEESRQTRRDVASALRQTADQRFRRLLVPLLYDPAPDVADEAMESVRACAREDFVFVPSLVSLLRHRRLKGSARAVLVSYGEPVVDALAHFLQDPDEDIWVRRHIPATLALIPGQRTVDVLAGALDDPDGFLRYKAVAALERLRRLDGPYTFPRERVEKLALSEARQFFNYLTLHHNLFGRGSLPGGSLLARALHEKMARTTDRIFRLLTLLHPWRDIGAAQWTLAHGDARARANASEYLDNILTGPLRRHIVPVLEDMPADEKVRRANVLLKTRARDSEETLLQLINDDDQVVAATAIDFVREHRMWVLADDIEHVLAHRDARDWYVFEAASWALAEHRMPAERRRELWHEPLPAAELVGRLRHLPLFSSVTVDELFRIASAARQVRHDPGAVLLHEGSVPETAHLLIDGRVVANVCDLAPVVLHAPAAIGFAETLSGMPMEGTLRTEGRAVTLAIPTTELRTLLSNNTDLVSGLFATLADTMATGAGPVQHTGAAADLERLARGGLSPVERVLALQRAPLFSRVSADEMLQLAEIAEVARYETGDTIFPESAPPALWVILSGDVALSGSAEQGWPAIAAGAGDVVGAIATLAGRQLGISATATRSGVALRVAHDDLFALLGERPDLLRQMFSGLFRPESARLLDTRV
jgi:ATP:ADP antiporter, AAA family